MPYYALIWSVHTCLCFLIMLCLYYHNPRKLTMYPEVWPCKKQNDRVITRLVTGVELNASESSDVETDIKLRKFSKSELLSKLPVMGGQGLKLRRVCHERLMMLSSIRRIFKVAISKQTTVSSPDFELSRDTDKAGGAETPMLSTWNEAILGEELACILEFKQKNNKFIPTMSWTGRGGLLQAVHVWKMLVSCLCAVGVGYNLCGWWLAIYYICISPFGIGLAAFSVKTWRKMHIFCTTLTIIGIWFGEVMTTIDIWNRERMSVQMAMTLWLMGSFLMIILFSVGVHNIMEWMFIFFLETYALGIAVSRNPFNPSSP